MSRRQPTKQNEEEEEEVGEEEVDHAIEEQLKKLESDDEVPPPKEALKRIKISPVTGSPGILIAPNKGTRKREMLKVAPKPVRKVNPPPPRKPYIPSDDDDDEFSRFISIDPAQDAYRRIHSIPPLERENTYLQIKLNEATEEIQRLKE